MKRINAVNIAYIYLRLSNEDQRQGESGSITNQRKILEDYCTRNNIIIAREFADDDWSGGNFNRPGFQSMIRALKADGGVNMVITKDLSRLGRDMSESSYYAERYFPEHGIRYIAVYDNFDSEEENFLAPFQFAINDVYLRDSSKKIKTALHTMMDRGEYCFRAPYGYEKNPHDNHKLLPNPETAPVVKRIFRTRLSMLKNTYGMYTYSLVLKPQTLPYFNHNKFVYAGGSVWDEATQKVMLSCRVPEDGSEYATLLDLLTPCEVNPMELAESVVPGLHDMVVQQYISTPHTWQRFTHTPDGSAYGIRKDCRQPLLTMLSPRTPISNLLLTGQNVMLHGLEGVAMTAQQTTGIILNNETSK